MSYAIRHRLEENLFALQENLGITTYEEFAQQIGRSRQWLQKALICDTNAGIDTLETIARKLGIEPEDLIKSPRGESIHDAPLSNPNIILLDKPKRPND